MGTDIHIWVEVRKDETEPWRKLGRQFPYKYYRPENETKVYPPDPDEGEYAREYISNAEFTDEPYGGRNYKLFAALAGVRNGSGFAGVRTGSKVVPVAEPRGWPDDLSPEMKEEERFIEHTPTWLMLREVLGYDWDQPITQVGVLKAAQYEALKAGTQPEQWSGGISGPGITVLSAEDYEFRKITGTLPDDRPPNRPDDWSGVYVQAEWPQEGGLRACIDDDWFGMITGMADAYDPDHCRFVFYFDS